MKSKKNFNLLILLVSCVIFFITVADLNLKIIGLPFSLDNITFFDFNRYNNIIVYTENGKTYIRKFKVLDEKKIELKDKVVGKIQEYYIVNKNNKHGLLDKNLNMKLEIVYDEIIDSGIKNKVLVTKDRRMKMIEVSKGVSIVTYDLIKKADKNNFLKIQQNKKYGYLDRNGKIIIKPNYIVLFPFYKDKAIARIEDKYGVISKNDEVIIPFEFDEIYMNENILLKKNKKYSWYKNIEKNIEVDKIFPSLERYLVFEKNKKYGIIDLKKGFQPENSYEEIEEKIREYTIVGQNLKYGILEVKNLQKEIKFDYDYLIRIDDEIFAGGTTESGMYRLIYRDRRFTDEIYERVEKLTDKYIIAYTESEIDLYTLKLKKWITLKKEDISFLNRDVIILKNKRIIQLK